MTGCASRPRTYDELVIGAREGRPDQQAIYGGTSTHPKYAGRRFELDPQRTVVAIDLDDCVIRTRYDVAVFHRFDNVSQPFEHARDTVEAISQDCQIIYVSARPWFYYPGTRYWLDQHGFPPA